MYAGTVTPHQELRAALNDLGRAIKRDLETGLRCLVGVSSRLPLMKRIATLDGPANGMIAVPLAIYFAIAVPVLVIAALAS